MRSDEVFVDDGDPAQQRGDQKGQRADEQRQKRHREKDVAPGPYRGAPDFVIEVLSPSNPEHDLWRKRDLYQRYGVREYWIVDPHGQSVYVFHFEKSGNSEDRGENPEKYSFDDNVPVGISDGACRVDFRRVCRKIRHFLE